MGAEHTTKKQREGKNISAEEKNAAFKKRLREEREERIKLIATNIESYLGNLNNYDLEMLEKYFEHKKHFSQNIRGLSPDDRRAKAAMALIVIAENRLAYDIAKEIPTIDEIIARNDAVVKGAFNDLTKSSEDIKNIFEDSRNLVVNLGKAIQSLAEFKAKAIDKEILTNGREVRDYKARQAKLAKAKELGIDIDAPDALDQLAKKEKEQAEKAAEEAKAAKEAIRKEQEEKRAQKQAEKEARQAEFLKEQEERFTANKALAAKHGIDTTGKSYAEVRDLVAPIKRDYKELKALGHEPDNMSIEAIQKALEASKSTEGNTVVAETTKAEKPERPKKDK